MSSWQQALSEDIRKGKRRECPVVMNRNQEKNLRTGRETADMPSWTCANCSHIMLGSYYRCEKCQVLRPEERANRMEMRAKDGELGRGGGYFERAPEGHREWNSDDEDYDEFGRKKKKRRESPSVRGGAGTRPASQGREAMSEKQKAALERLRLKTGCSGGAARVSRSRSARRR